MFILYHITMFKHRLHSILDILSVKHRPTRFERVFPNISLPMTVKKTFSSLVCLKIMNGSMRRCYRT